MDTAWVTQVNQKTGVPFLSRQVSDICLCPYHMRGCIQVVNASVRLGLDSNYCAGFMGFKLTLPFGAFKTIRYTKSDSMRIIKGLHTAPMSKTNG